jgi:hypothetical protein
MVKKEDIWKHENPICTFNTNILNNGYFYVLVKIVEDLRLHENNVVLFRLGNVRNEVCTSKLSKVKYSKNSHVLKLSSKILKNYNVGNKPSIEIIQIKDIGNNNSCCEVSKEFIDICSLMQDFVCFKRPGNWLTIHGLSGKTQSVTVPHYIEVDEIFSWNLGFYLAEGLKGGIRCGVANEKEYLLKIFRDYAEKYLGIERSNWYVDVSIAKKVDSSMPYWTKALEVEPKQIHLKITKHNPPKSRYGVPSIIIHRKILGELQKRLIRNTQIYEIIKQKKELSFAFIRGLEAGDGAVLNHNGCIEPTITCLKEDVQLVVNLLSFIHEKKPLVRESHTCNKVSMVFYRGLNMAREYIINGHFKEHKERRQKLLSLFKSKKVTEIKYLEALKQPKTTKELSNLFDVSYRASNQVLKYLHRFDLIKQKIGSVNNRRRCYKTRYFDLSERGNKLLEELNPIQI